MLCQATLERCWDHLVLRLCLDQFFFFIYLVIGLRVEHLYCAIVVICILVLEFICLDAFFLFLMVHE